ncbi:RimK family alpha-L-glutamate ligase [Streptomyces sp. NPDC004111]|uniref:ATP-grasp domain-containing protein n=1 Tax=Streptomyces sp. NPDC004111 TaxID=3364690 RepID=UPI003693D829
MRIALITPDPAHPLLAATTALLAPRHTVTAIDPRRATKAGRGPASPLADVYLLKSRTPQALALAHDLERRGARVVNGAAATALLQDRTAMAERALAAGLPFAATRTHASLTELAAGPPLPGPVVVKSRRSAKDDLVARVDSAARLRELAAARPDAREPVVVQDFAPNDGWDHKVWAIEDRLFAARRRSELAEPVAAVGPAGPPQPGRGPTVPLGADQLPSGWAELTRRVREVFGLDVYGVDFVEVVGRDGRGTPLIVDINAFPGIREQPGAPEALAALALGNGRA